MKYLTRSWWCSAAVATPAQAQMSLDRFCVDVADERRRGAEHDREARWQRGVAGAAAGAPFPAEICVERPVSRSALVAFEGNHYSVPAALAGAPQVTVRARLGEQTLAIVSAAGTQVAKHRRAPAGTGQLIRSAEHAAGLEQAVLSAFTTQPAVPAKAEPSTRPGRACGCGRPARRATRQRRRWCGDRPGALRPARTGGAMSEKDGVYQQLRGYLAALKLPAIAEALAPALEQAEQEKPGYTRFLADLLGSRGSGDPGARAYKPSASCWVPADQDAGGVRLRRAAQPGPASDRGARHAAVRRRRKPTCCSSGRPVSARRRSRSRWA